MVGEKTLLDFLSGIGVTFTVPAYQRDYDWDKKNVEEFMNTLYSILIGEKEKVFINSITTHQQNKKNNIKEIDDGQQRITTFSLICAALLNYKGELAESTRYLLRTALFDRKDNIKLVLHPDDNCSYSKIILNKYDELNKQDKKSKISSSYKIIYDNIKDWLTYSDYTCEDLADSITKIFIKENECDDEDEAIQVFQALNSTGKQIADSDNIRSLLQSYINKEDEARKKQHDEILSSIKKSCVKVKLRDYFYMLYAYYRNGVYKKGIDLVREYKQNICNQSNISDIMNDIYKFLDFFSKYINGDEGFNNEKKTIRDFFSFVKPCCKEFSSSAWSTIIIDMFSGKFDMSEIDKIKILKYAERCWAIRHIYNDTSNTGKLFANFIGDAIDESNKEQTSLIEAFKHITKDRKFYKYLNVNDDFIPKFANNMYKSNTPMLLYILNKIENKLDGAEYVEYPAVNIEHVLCKNNNDDKDYIYKIGNITLLPESVNKSLQDKSYSDKKSSYDNSSLTLNSYFQDKTSWGEQEIQERGEELAKIFLSSLS